MSRYFTNFNETLGSAVYPQSAAPAFAAEEASLPVQPDEEMQRESIVPRREPARQRWSSQTEADADNNQLSDIQNESGADSGAAPMPGKGYLLVQVSLAGRSIPVEGAAVTVQSSEGKRFGILSQMKAAEPRFWNFRHLREIVTAARKCRADL